MPLTGTFESVKIQQSQYFANLKIARSGPIRKTSRMNPCFAILAASTASEAERFGQATGGGLEADWSLLTSNIKIKGRDPRRWSENF